MGKFIKLLIVVAFAGGLLYAGSYVGARATVGKFLGSPPPQMGARTVRLVWRGVETLPQHPRAWEFSYSRASINQNRPVRIFVSPGGKILSTVPRDLDRRLEAFHRSREIQ
jgi:hypothetical protein